jgi:hypothetical protein
MKYWKGIDSKFAYYGTMDDGGIVPDSVPATKEEYDEYVSSLIDDKPKKKQLKDVLLKKGIITQIMYDEVI